MPESEHERFQAKLKTIKARLKALEDAEEDASWGRIAATRGGFRQERDDLLREADGTRAELS